MHSPSLTSKKTQTRVAGTVGERRAKPAAAVILPDIVDPFVSTKTGKNITISVDRLFKLNSKERLQQSAPLLRPAAGQEARLTLHRQLLRDRPLQAHRPP
ncbi:unnamed protein product [Ranitomeya imitator]|uniref:Uncharacterized protein n=1 Tax=Ranitomeya imitator TaxID=111125 RepID=A0ABN9LJZ2_9NEOB|nr:unnamed protein product [Ranitomeya imitator]